MKKVGEDLEKTNKNVAKLKERMDNIVDKSPELADLGNRFDVIYNQAIELEAVQHATHHPSPKTHQFQVQKPWESRCSIIIVRQIPHPKYRKPKPEAMGWGSSCSMSLE